MESPIPNSEREPSPQRRGFGVASLEGASLKTLGQFGSIGFEMAVFIVLGVKGGEWLDGHFGTRGFVLAGLGLGLFAGFRSLFQLTRRLRALSASQEAGG